MHKKESPGNTYSVAFFPKFEHLNDELKVYQNVGLQTDLVEAQIKGLTKQIIREKDCFNKTLGEEHINLKIENLVETVEQFKSMKDELQAFKKSGEALEDRQARISRFDTR